MRFSGNAAAAMALLFVLPMAPARRLRGASRHPSHLIRRAEDIEPVLILPAQNEPPYVLGGGVAPPLYPPLDSEEAAKDEKEKNNDKGGKDAALTPVPAPQPQSAGEKDNKGKEQEDKPQNEPAYVARPVFPEEATEAGDKNNKEKDEKGKGGKKEKTAAAMSDLVQQALADGKNEKDKNNEKGDKDAAPQPAAQQPPPATMPPPATQPPLVVEPAPVTEPAPVAEPAPIAPPAPVICSAACADDFRSGCMQFHCDQGSFSDAYETCRGEIESAEGPLSEVCAPGCEDTEEMRSCPTPEPALVSEQGQEVCSTACADDFRSGCMQFHCGQGAPDSAAYSTCRSELDAGEGPLSFSCAPGCVDTEAMTRGSECGCDSACPR